MTEMGENESEDAAGNKKTHRTDPFSEIVPGTNPGTPTFPTEVSAKASIVPEAPFSTPVDPEVVELALDYLMKKRIVPDEHLREPVLMLLSRYKLSSLLKSDYDRAASYEDATAFLVEAHEGSAAQRQSRIQ